MKETLQHNAWRYLKRVGFCSILAFQVLSTTGTAQAGSLYGITFDNELIKIDTATGAGSLVGNLSSSMAAFGLGTRGGKLYTFDQVADVIRELDPATGGTVNTYDVGIVAVGEGGLGFRSDGIGFVSAASGGTGTLWSFDLNALTSNLIGSLDPSMDGLDVSSGGVLYGLSQNTSSLYTIDQTTGATTLVGNTGFANGTSLSGLAFGGGGALFGLINDNLYTINVGTGAATLVGAIGFDRLSGLGYVDDTPGVPDHAATMPLLAMAMMLCFGCYSAVLKRGEFAVSKA